MNRPSAAATVSLIPNTFCSALLLAVAASGCTTDPAPGRAPSARGSTAALGLDASFDTSEAGAVPDGWSIRETGQPTATATWTVTADATAASKPNVLALTATTNTGSIFNLAVAERSSFKDLDLSVKVKAVTGEEDQGGGPIWRCQDRNNYYTCRFNPLEGNFRVYSVKGGRRTQLETAEVETQAGRWYVVRVTMVGERIACYLNGEKLLEATDDTFKESGRVGLWTKADAATSFDDLLVREIEPE